MKTAIGIVMCASALWAADSVDPTFLRRSLSSAPEAAVEITTASCRYHPLFGAGDKNAGAPKSVARYGLIAASGDCRAAKYPAEEQILFVLEGSGTLLYGGVKHAIKKGDFAYLPPGIEHMISGSLRAIWMGFRPAPGSPPRSLDKPLIANVGDVPKQVVGNHPPTTLYQLMIGNQYSKRDKIAAGLLMNSLFVMEFAPGGTNAPHHHDREEEVYLLLDGAGEMVAGGGMDGIEGRFPAKAGDAYFFRLNTTVGFYNAAAGPVAHILAVRSAPPPKGKE